MGIWAKMQSRIVYGESAGKTAILMSSGSVEAGITAYSLLLDSSWQQLGTVVEISPEIHSPIWQSYAVLQQGIGHPALNAFLQYLHAPQTQRMLQAWGYEPAVEGTAMGGPQLGSDRKLDFQPFLLSGLLALATTLALLLVGIPLAWWLSVPSGKWKAVPEVLVTLPLILPPTVLGFYLLLALSPESWLGGTFSEVFGMDLSFSFLGLWIASMVYSLPFMVNPLLAGFRQLPAHLSEAGSVFGLGRWQILRKLLLPNLWGTIGSAAIFTFAHTVGEFGVVLMIGGSVPGKTRVVSIALYEEVETLQYGNAHIYAVILLAFAFVTLLIARLLSQGRKHTPI
jgi:molybdate transport system permease protein